jgi:hypothetical protein
MDQIQKSGCSGCGDTPWVCEAHPEWPWDGPKACGCGGAGKPCPECNVSDQDHHPRLPKGFEPTFDIDDGEPEPPRSKPSAILQDKPDE